MENLLANTLKSADTVFTELQEVEQIFAIEKRLASAVGCELDKDDKSPICIALRGFDKSSSKERKEVIEHLTHLHETLHFVIDRKSKQVETAAVAKARWRAAGKTIDRQVAAPAMAPKMFEVVARSIQQAKTWKPKKGSMADKIFKVIEHPNFQYVMTANIFLTGIIHGLFATSWVREDKTAKYSLCVVDLLTLCVATLDVFAYISTFGYRTIFNGWEVLDILVVFPSWIGVLIGFPYWSFGVARTLRLTRQFDASKILVEGFVMALPSILWVFLIIFINTCVFTVIGVQFFREKSPDQYGDIRTGLYTSFKLITLENWTDEAELLRQEYKYGTLFFVLFITTNSFILLNLLIATVVDMIREIGYKKDEKKAQKELERARKRQSTVMSASPLPLSTPSPGAASKILPPLKASGRKSTRIGMNSLYEEDSATEPNVSPTVERKVTNPVFLTSLSNVARSAAAEQQPSVTMADNGSDARASDATSIGEMELGPIKHTASDQAHNNNNDGL